MRAKISGGVSGNYAKRFYTKDATVTELQHVFAIRMKLAKYADSTVAGAFRQLPHIYNQKRFNAIISSLNYDWDELCIFLREAWVVAVMSFECFIVNESILAFHPGEHQPDCPKIFIPRKPHPNGLLVYNAAFKLSNGLPFVFDLEPDIGLSPLSSQTALLSICNRWRWPSTFMSPLMMGFLPLTYIFTRIPPANASATVSMNPQHARRLYELLKQSCQHNKCIAVVNETGIVYSLTKHDKGAHFVVTNAFSTSNNPDPPQCANSSDVNLLAKHSPSLLALLAHSTNSKIHAHSISTSSLVNC